MKYKKAVEICRMFMTDNELSKVTMGNGTTDLMVDVHGMTVMEAKRYIKNLIVAVSRRVSEFVLLVIHGFHNGHAIRDMLWSGPVCSQVRSVRGSRKNPGVTWLVVQG